MRGTFLTIALAALAETVVAGQEPATKPSEAAPAAEDRSASRPAIRVLQNPYDIGSFYRAGGSSPEGWAGLANDPAYRIAGFYRSQQGRREGIEASPYGWSRFWTSGYSARRPIPFPSYRRTIGENGDLFLLVPFLAPAGPMTSVLLAH